MNDELEVFENVNLTYDHREGILTVHDCDSGEILVEFNVVEGWS